MNTTRNTLPSGVVVVVLAAILLAVPVPASTDEDVRATASDLVAWLSGGTGNIPIGILADRGTVQFGLRTLGSARSTVGRGQAEAVLRDLREIVQRHRITIGSVDVEESSWAWVRVGVEDRDGRTVAVVLLAFHAEEDRWVLRELRETSP